VTLMSPSHPSASLRLEVLEQSEEAVAVVNPEGLAIYAYRALTERLGLAGDEILGRPLPVA
jgi:PAS domain-containing protein